MTRARPAIVRVTDSIAPNTIAGGDGGGCAQPDRALQRGADRHPEASWPRGRLEEWLRNREAAAKDPNA
jgi:hypothetical protein